MENKEYKDLKELIELSDEAETLSEDECFHSKDMTVKELMTKAEDRPYYILLQRKDKYVKEDLYIYVDRHDYLLYKRPEWREWRNARNEERCLIPNGKGGLIRCMKKCSECKELKSGKPASLDRIKDNTNYEKEDDSPDSQDLMLIEEAKSLLWSIIEKYATPEQLDKIKLHYKYGYTQAEIADKYNVSHNAISKTIHKLLLSLADKISADDKEFLVKYLINK